MRPHLTLKICKMSDHIERTKFKESAPVCMTEKEMKFTNRKSARQTCICLHEDDLFLKLKL